jgi:hypothetical protein
MANLKMHLLVKCLTYWNLIRSYYNWVIVEYTNFYTHINYYFNGLDDLWVFLPGHSTPITLNTIDSKQKIDIDWLFDRGLCILDHYNNSSEEISCQLPWLSANIVIIDPESPSDPVADINIDDFISEFRVQTTADKVPSLNSIFLSWCIYSRNWFNGNYDVNFHIIDECGENIIINLDKHNNNVTIKHRKLHVIIHNSKEEER